MKKLLVVFTIMISMAFGTTQSSFCNGFADGYKAGWCYKQGMGCVAPIKNCAVRPVGVEYTYKGGYQTGFATGLKDREND